MLLGTISGMLFALGLCMVLIPEWSAAGTGTVLGGTGIVGAFLPNIYECFTLNSHRKTS